MRTHNRNIMLASGEVNLIIFLQKPRWMLYLPNQAKAMHSLGLETEL